MSLERFARRLPRHLRNTALDLLNPLRKRRVMREIQPRWLTLFVTNRCNARCDHCFYWDSLNDGSDELSLNHWCTLLGSLKGPLNTLRLSGGEPFLRRDIPDLFAYIDERRIATKMSIPTHGMLDLVPRVTAMAESARHTHLNVSISLDGFAERHDRFRKIPRGFDKAVANLRRLVALEERVDRFNVSVSMSLARDFALAGDGADGGSDGGHEGEAERLTRFLRDDVGVSSIGYDHIRDAGRDVFDLPADMDAGFVPPPVGESGKAREHLRPGVDLHLSPDEMETVNARLARHARSRADRITFERMATQVAIKRKRGRLVDCLAGYVDCVVYPDGGVAVCEMSTPFANLHDFAMDLDRLLHSEEAVQARARTRRCACTHPCHLSDSLAYDNGFLKRFLDED
ncbi:MAG: radical SAM protein [Gammaproteobacteria bacterium]